MAPPTALLPANPHASAHGPTEIHYAFPRNWINLTRFRLPRVRFEATEEENAFNSLQPLICGQTFGVTGAEENEHDVDALRRKAA